MPLRSIVALSVVTTIAALIVWMLARPRWWPPPSIVTRVVLLCGIVVLAGAGLWIVFVLPAYWD
jgi:hypothetical protein